MAKKLGVAVVGFDHWYTAFPAAQAAATMKETRLVAMADLSRVRLKELAEKYPADYTTTDLNRVLDDPEVELVCSLINTRDNVEVATAALLAGKHVACVKPMAMNLKQVDKLIALAEKQKRLLWCFDQLGRTGINPQIQAALDQKLIGTPISYHHTMFAGLPLPWPGKTGKSWWMDAEQVPWGAWADHAIYTIDQLRALFKSEVAEVCGEIGNRVYKNFSVDDHGIGLLKFENGMEAVIEDAWVAQGYHPYWTKITGTAGVIRMDHAVYGDAIMLNTPKGLKARAQRQDSPEAHDAHHAGRAAQEGRCVYRLCARLAHQHGRRARRSIRRPRREST